MVTVINSVSSIYIYKTNKKTWKHPDNIGVYCLAYQVTGNYTHKFSDKTLTVKEDTLFLISQYTPYSVQCVEKGEAICVTFRADTDLPSSVYDCKANPEIKNLFSKLLNYKNLQLEGNHCEAMAIIYKLFSFILKKREASYVAITTREKVQNAYNHMISHYTEPSFSIAELAAKCDMSPKYFRVIFKKLYNSAPSQHLISLRLQTATKLLLESDMSISDISKASGFSDIYYFSKMFKARFACTPKEYRKQSITDPVRVMG